MGTITKTLRGVGAGTATITASDGTPKNTAIAVVECYPVWNISPIVGQTLNSIQGVNTTILIGYDADAIGTPGDFVLTSDAPEHFSSTYIGAEEGRIRIVAACNDARTVHATLEFVSQEKTYSISFTVAFYAYSTNCVDPTTGDRITSLDFSQGDITAEFVFSTDMPYGKIEFRPSPYGYVYSPDQSQIDNNEIIFTDLHTTGSHGGFLFKMKVNEDNHPIPYGTIKYGGSVRINKSISVNVDVLNFTLFTITGQFE